MTRARRLVGIIAAAVGLAIIAPTAQAADAPPAADSKDADGESSRDDRLEDRTRRLGDKIKSVQRKVFVKRMRHELMVQAATSLNDAFFQQFTVGGAYTFHPLEWLGLEVNAKYFLPPVRTDLTTVIRSTPATGNIQIYSPILTLTADIQFAPIYGKLSLFAEKTIHYDFYISGGFGAILTENTAAPWHPLGAVALGARVMATEWLTVRFEIKDAIYNDTRSSIVASAIQNMLLFNLGVSFFLPPSFDYRSE